MTAVAQYILISKFAQYLDLSLVVQAGLVLSGFLITSFLLQGQEEVKEAEESEAEGLVERCRAMFQTIPIPQMIVVILAVIYLPRLLALESIPVPDVPELPALIVRTLGSYFSDFQKPAFDGSTLWTLPLVVLLVPRRALSLVFLGILGSGLVMQFAGLFSDEIRPATVLISPSAFDLLSVGAFLAVVLNRDNTRRGESHMSRWAIVLGLTLAIVLVGARFKGNLPSWGSVALLYAPQGFGLFNFMLEIMATTLVSCLWWRDLGGMLEGVKQAAAV